MRFAAGLVGPSDARNVVHEAVVKALRAPKWGSVENKRAQLYRAVLNEARSHHRSTIRRRAREAWLRVADVSYQPEICPEVLEAVSRLRAAVFLTYSEGLTPPQVAARLGIAEGSVRRHLARARARLRKVLDD